MIRGIPDQFRAFVPPAVPPITKRICQPNNQGIEVIGVELHSTDRCLTLHRIPGFITHTQCLPSLLPNPFPLRGKYVPFPRAMSNATDPAPTGPRQVRL